MAWPVSHGKPSGQARARTGHGPQLLEKSSLECVLHGGEMMTTSRAGAGRRKDSASSGSAISFAACLITTERRSSETSITTRTRPDVSVVTTESDCAL
eukprot:16439564-Heterocapsa_arctica.AAC.1